MSNNQLTTTCQQTHLDDAVNVAHGLTVPEFARRYRIGKDRVRAMIRRGELAAINTAPHRCGRPRFIITPEAMAAFEQGHAAQADTPKPRRKKRRPKGYIEFFPE
jgi:hypothetical protein